MANNYKIILQKDVPERTRLSKFGIDYVSNTILMNSIISIFKNEVNTKPFGFWYSLKWYWIDNLMNGYEYWNIDYSADDNRKYYITDKFYLYGVDIDTTVFTSLSGKKGINKILLLKNYSDMLKFYKKYKQIYEKDPMEEYIDWKKVYMDYGGIELAVIHLENYFSGESTVDPSLWNDADKVKWWHNWDIASGCVWNNEIISNIRLII